MGLFKKQFNYRELAEKWSLLLRNNRHPQAFGKALHTFVAEALEPQGKECVQFFDWLAPRVAEPLDQFLSQEKGKLQSAATGSVAELKAQICANLSHELRTPLTSILGFAELLSEEVDGPLGPEQKKHVEQIKAGGETLLKVLSAFVDMARVGSGEYPLQIAQFSLGPVVNSVLGEVAFSGETRIENRLDRELPMVYGDPDLVRKIFRNLLDNAAKYTPRGSVELSGEKKGEMLEICVADTGIGMKPETIGNIFDHFYQASSGLSREYAGTGVGLSLSKKLVEVHGGRLWAQSQMGQGSRFFFTLPLKPIAIRHKELAA